MLEKFKPEIHFDSFLRVDVMRSSPGLFRLFVGVPGALQARSNQSCPTFVFNHS